MALKLRFLALLQLANCYRLFDSPFELPDYVPQICREALSEDIDCPFVVSAEEVRDFDGLKSKFYDSPRALYCADPCRSSLGGFPDNVVVACGDFKDRLWENISESRSTMEFAESILWARDLFYLKEKLHSTPDSRLSTNTQDTCKGIIYTVQKGDTCESISKVMPVATDRLIERNGLTYTCSDLLEGRNLCMEDACEIARIEQGQTCQDFAKWKWFSTIQHQSWNPDALVSAKPSQTTMNSTPVTTTEPLEPYKTRLPKIDVNPGAANSKAELLKYCWLTDESWDYALGIKGPSEDCQSLMEVYCTFRPERPSPTAPSSIPETCTPGSDVDEL
ncbi:hypothetical protein Neosp_010503 [[Neocosmospora] mangrovei]